MSSFTDDGSCARDDSRARNDEAEVDSGGKKCETEGSIAAIFGDAAAWVGAIAQEGAAGRT